MITSNYKSNLPENVQDMNLDLLEAYSKYKQHSNFKYTAETEGGFKNINLQSFVFPDIFLLKMVFGWPLPFELFNMFLFRIQVGKQVKICKNILWHPYI